MRTHAAIMIFAAIGFAAPAMADDLNLPARKPGLWVIEMSRATGAPMMTTKLCLDASSDKALMEKGMAMGGGDCQNTSINRNGNTIATDGICKMGPMTIKSHTVISGDFQSSYTIDSVSDITGGGTAMPKHSETKQTATWSGDCGDLKPGDMQMPNGMKVNILKGMPKPGG
jgi:hypothetical protein